MKRIPKKRQDELREILREEKRALWDELRTEIFRRGENLRDQFDMPRDIGDQGILDVLADTGLAVAGIYRERLTRMEDVEHRLEQGTYGICEVCGKEIPKERLRVMPYSTCCITCQEQREGPPSLTGKTM
jgi:DnaK suppressor protein